MWISKTILKLKEYLLKNIMKKTRKNELSSIRCLYII